MTTSLTRLLNLPGVAVESFDSSLDSVCFQLSVLAKGTNCPSCHKYTEEFHQSRPILVRDLPICGKNLYLRLPRRRFYCKICQRYITEQLQFVDWRRTYTQRYEETIYSQVNHSSIETVSQQQHLRIEQVKNILNYINQKRTKKNHFELN